MGVYTDEAEFSSAISAPRLFKALAIDAHNFIPKLLPQVVKSLQIIQGDGGPGSIRQMHFVEGEILKSITNRIDEMNEETLTFAYTTIGGDTLGDKFESINHQVKFEATAEGSSKNKITIKYYTKAGYGMTEEEIKRKKERTLGTYKVVEAYLLQNPHVDA